MKQLSFILLSMAWLAAGVAVADQAARRDRPAEPAVKSLDDLLLDDLSNDLLEGLDAPVAQEPRNPPRPEVAKPQDSELDQRLLEQLGGGEDLGKETSDPFLLIGEDMRTAEQLISRRDASERTQRLQEQIVGDIQRLIDELNRQCAGGQCNNSSQAPSPPKDGAKPGSKAGSGENRGGSKPARDSESRVGRSDANDARMAQVMEMYKQIWGHLPDRLREQMQSGMAEEFLPQYERFIERYYQRLAEQPATR